MDIRQAAESEGRWPPVWIFESRNWAQASMSEGRGRLPVAKSDADALSPYMLIVAKGKSSPGVVKQR
jgi:hypothetical protein